MNRNAAGKHETMLTSRFKRRHNWSCTAFSKQDGLCVWPIMRRSWVQFLITLCQSCLGKAIYPALTQSTKLKCVLAISSAWLHGATKRQLFFNAMKYG